MDVRPGAIDRSTLGHPGKFSYCVAEDEEDTTWLSLSEQRGLPKEASAVTVMAAGAPRQIMNEWTTKPEEILETFAAEMRANLRHYSIHPGNYALIIPKQLREHLQAASWSKTDIADFIHERARIHRREWAEVGKGAVVRDRGDSVYPAMESPDQLLVDRRRRAGRRLRRHHPAVARQQEPCRDLADRRLRRLRTAKEISSRGTP